MGMCGNFESPYIDFHGFVKNAHELLITQIGNVVSWFTLNQRGGNCHVSVHVYWYTQVRVSLHCDEPVLYIEGKYSITMWIERIDTLHDWVLCSMHACILKYLEVAWPILRYRLGMPLEKPRKPNQNLTQLGRCPERNSNLNRSQKRCRLHQFSRFIGSIRTSLFIVVEAGTRPLQNDVAVGYREARIVSLAMVGV
jgi:hypothetical protein